MSIETFDVREKRRLIGLVLLATEVDFPPSNKSPGPAAGKFRERIRRQAFQTIHKFPPVAATFDAVDVPRERSEIPRDLGGNGQLPALGEGGSFQTQSESS